MTGQFGKNHLGDRDEHLPTNHGFDEFFGNLYHLNAEEEPENPDYPGQGWPGPTGAPSGKVRPARRHQVLRRRPHRGHRPADKKRMETVDEEVTAAALDFIDRAAQGRQALLRVVELAPACTSGRTSSPSPRGKTGSGIYADGMVEHDGHGGPAARQARRAGHRRQHHRHVLHRQRRRGLHLARRRHHDVPPGRRPPTGKAASGCPRSSAGRASSSRARSQRDRVPRGHAATLLAAAGETNVKETC